MEISQVFTRQKEFFLSNQTKPVAFRLQQLDKLEKLLRANESALNQAIYTDFGKSAFETYLTELAMVYHEISQFRKKPS
jgi:aldehyde dehydrogenase (NAD+)